LGRWVFRRKLLVLAYHATPDVRAFRAQVDYLAKHHRVVSLADVAAAQSGSRPLPPNAALITFDDGSPSLVETALPALSQHNMPSVAFVIAGLIGTDVAPWWVQVNELSKRRGDRDPDGVIRALKAVPDAVRRATIAELVEELGEPSPYRNLDPDDLRVMERGGMEIGSHSFDHPCLDRCTDQAISNDLGQAHNLLTEWLGHAPRAIAYPNGNNDSRVVSAARRLGYSLGFAFDHRLAVLPADEPLLLSRVRVDASDPAERFARATSGAHPAVHHALGRP
jgi:peptidoglycan/xylan/chitin deacetylase (PgdA/CDA1 family)